MTGAPSLAQRLSRTLILWVGGVWLLCILGVSWYVYREVNHNFDNELAESSHRMFDIAIHDWDRVGAPARQAPLVAPDPLIAGDEILFHLLDGDGRLLMRSAQAPAEAFGVPLSTGFSDAGPWRIYTVRHPSRPLFLQLADPLGERREALTSTLLGLAIPMAAALPLLALLLRAIARRELRLLQRLEEEIAQRSGTDLRPVPLDGLPAELSSVGDHVNRLLERLSHALDVERALAANAAHELRTPLAAARLRLQTALEHGLAAADVQAALDSLSTLSHRTEKLLQLSRAESGAALGHAPVDLASVAAAVVQEFWQSEAVRQRLHLQVAEEGLQPVLGDADSLAIALRNLVENALRHGGSSVTVALEAPCGLAVRDNGPGVPEGRLQALLQRHVRQGRGAGWGLGLSIVNTIVRNHGGSLALGAPPGGGFEARIRLRAAG